MQETRALAQIQQASFNNVVRLNYNALQIQISNQQPRRKEHPMARNRDRYHARTDVLAFPFPNTTWPRTCHSVLSEEGKRKEKTVLAAGTRSTLLPDWAHASPTAYAGCFCVLACLPRELAGM